jgi:hypothetical protein
VLLALAVAVAARLEMECATTDRAARSMAGVVRPLLIALEVALKCPLAGVARLEMVCVLVALAVRSMAGVVQALLIALEVVAEAGPPLKCPLAGVARLEMVCVLVALAVRSMAGVVQALLIALEVLAEAEAVTAVRFLSHRLLSRFPSQTFKRALIGTISSRGVIELPTKDLSMRSIRLLKDTAFIGSLPSLLKPFGNLVASNTLKRWLRQLLHFRRVMLIKTVTGIRPACSSLTTGSTIMGEVTCSCLGAPTTRHTEVPGTLMATQTIFSIIQSLSQPSMQWILLLGFLNQK